LSRIVDVVTAFTRRVAVLAALYYEAATLGRGHDTRSISCTPNLAMLANQSAGWLASGLVPEALGNVIEHRAVRTYRAGDGPADDRGRATEAQSRG